MNKFINKIRRVLNISVDSKVLINSFQIGYQYFIIYELEKTSEIIRNDLLSKFLNTGLDFLWFRSYYEFEICFDLLNINEQINFIIIG